MDFYIKPKVPKYTIQIESDDHCTIISKKHQKEGKHFLLRSELFEFTIEWQDESQPFTLGEPGTYYLTHLEIRRKSLLSSPVKEKKLTLKWTYMREYIDKIQLFPLECIIPYDNIDCYYYYRLSVQDFLNNLHPNVDRFLPTPLAQCHRFLFSEKFPILWEDTKKLIKKGDRKSNAKMIAVFVDLVSKVYPMLYSNQLSENSLTAEELLATKGPKFAYNSINLPYAFKPFHTDELNLNKNNLL
eukprot:NODE_8_length_66115_cov_0.981823.p28 type:complete len:243 gc:universal NODE_8_length_66115_cov_0.981823:57360-56632(-)